MPCVRQGPCQSGTIQYSAAFNWIAEIGSEYWRLWMTLNKVTSSFKEWTWCTRRSEFETSNILSNSCVVAGAGGKRGAKPGKSLLMLTLKISASCRRKSHRRVNEERAGGVESRGYVIWRNAARSSSVWWLLSVKLMCQFVCSVMRVLLRKFS